MAARTKPLKPLFEFMIGRIKNAKSLMEETEAVGKRTKKVPVTKEAEPDLDAVTDALSGEEVAGRKLVEGPTPGQIDGVVGEQIPGEKFNADPMDVGEQLSAEEQNRLIASRGTSAALDERGRYISGNDKYTNMNFRTLNSEEDLTGFMNESMRIQEERAKGLPGSRKLKDVEAEAINSVTWEDITTAAREGRRLTDAELTYARMTEEQLFKDLTQMTDDMLAKIDNGTVTELDEVEHAKFGAAVTAVHRYIGGEKKKASQALNSLRIDMDNQLLSNYQREEALAAIAAQSGSFKSRLTAIRNARTVDEAAEIVENDGLVRKLARIGGNHWFNNLLALFAPAKAAIGGTVTTTLYPTETLVTATIGSLRRMITKNGPEVNDLGPINDQARFGEAMIEYTGLFSGTKDALAPLWRHLKDPTYRIGESRNMRYMRPEDTVHGNLAAKRPQGTLGPDDKYSTLGPVGMVKDVSAQVVDGFLQNASSRLLLMTDMVVKSVAFRKVVDKLAYRTAINEGLEGADLVKRVEEIIMEMPDEVFEEAIQTGKRATLTQDLKIPWFENTNKFITNTRGLKFFAPFTKTMLAGSELAIERIPGFGLMSPRIREMWKAGGEQRDRVLGQWTVGMTIIGMGANAAMDGKATSGAGYSKQEQSARYKEHWRPGNVGDDGSYWNMSFYSPMSELYMVGVASYEMFDRQNHGLLPSDPQWKSRTQITMEMLPQAAWVFVEMNMNKSVGTGFRELIEAIDDPARHANRKFVRMVQPMFQIWGSKAARRMDDPVRRRVANSNIFTELWDSVQNDTPTFEIGGFKFGSENLQPQVGYFGEDKPEYGLSDLFGYMPGTKHYAQFEQLFANGKHVSMPYQKLTIGGKGSAVTVDLDRDLTPDQYKDSYIKEHPLAATRGYAYSRFCKIRGETYLAVLSGGEIDGEVVDGLFSRGSEYWDKEYIYGKANSQDGNLTKGDLIDIALSKANTIATALFTEELSTSLKSYEKTMKDVRGRIRTGVESYDVPEGTAMQSKKAEQARQDKIREENRQGNDMFKAN